MRQSQAAERLEVTARTLSLWECDRIHPTWTHQPAIVEFLGYDPFTNPALGGPGSNKPPAVAFLSEDEHTSFGQQIRNRRLELKKTRKQLAKEMGVSVKSLWSWETNRRDPNAHVRAQIITILGLALD